MKDIFLRLKKASTKVFRVSLKRWYITLIIFGLIGYFFYSQQARTAKAQSEKTYEVKRENLENTLSLSGKIEASEKVELHFQTGGKLTWVGVKEGDKVKKYQGIASLDQREVQKRLEKYLNLFSKERSDFDQSHDDNEDLTIGLTQEIRDRAKRVLDQSQADLNNAVLDVELQTIAKEYAYLYTPIEGIVTKVDEPSAGVNISLTDTYEVINPDTLYFSISADQTEVVKLHEGMQGKVNLDSYPDQELTGTITSISFTPKANETGTVYEVKMALAIDPKIGYRMGMTGDVAFILNTIPNTVAIPSEYIEEADNKTYVYKKVNGARQKVEVQIGEEYDGMTQIRDGLFAGDVIYEITK